MILAPLKTISPSRFDALRGCALQVVLEKSFPQGVLPPTVYMLAGSLVHRIAERAFLEAPSNAEELALIWQNETVKFEAQLQQYEATALLVPLRYSIPNFAVRKALFLRTWKYRPVVKNWKSGEDSKGGAEQFLTDAKHVVAGKADLLLHTSAGWVIKDFKTGMMHDPVTGQAKPEYALQLKLYAALCEQKHGEWPVRLVLENAAGEELDVPFTAAECSILLLEAQQLLVAINQRIGAGEVEQLASPDTIRCSRCQARPLCPVYVNEVRQAFPETTTDVLGAVVSFTVHNGRLQLLLELGGTRRQLLANGPASTRLHAQIAKLTGQEILVCNVKGTANVLTFTATDTSSAMPILAYST
ncbi:RecB family exonuclease [Hymenobacter psoromatis]|uniref:RecB family exonuclease n=1 Tax=Hymenobacter psoromatis TaxID=1484116 RepID=UPI001CBBCD0A|nr:PD-(D/E)XK nuclease family protein [Hymenobacter psoromatis]